VELFTNLHTKPSRPRPGACALLFTVGLLLASSSAWAQISLVHVTTCGSGAFPATTCTIPPTASGNLLVVGWASIWGTTPTTNGITDNAGNSYAQAGNSRSIDSTNEMVDLWYAKNVKSGTNLLTINPNPSGNTGAAVIWEFSGVDTVSPLDQSAVLNTQPGTATPFGASVTTSTPNELVISIMAPAGGVTGITAGNQFTSDSLIFGAGWAHMITSSAGAYAGQWNTGGGVFHSSTVSFKAAGTGGLNACDLTRDGSVNDSDVTLAVNMVLGLASCTASIQAPNTCDAVTVQRVVNAALQGTCLTGTVSTPHSITLSWVASVSSNVAGYNVYRSTSSGGPYTKINSSTVTGISYVDNTVQAGTTYYYVMTAKDSSNNESAYSAQASAVVPTP
jgi:hypothetical protein